MFSVKLVGCFRIYTARSDWKIVLVFPYFPVLYPTKILIRTLYCVHNCDDQSCLHIFLFSSNHLCDLSYIHLHSSPSMGLLQTHNVTSSLTA